MGSHTIQPRDFDKLEHRRFMAAALFDQGLSKAAVARETGVSFASARRWFESWKVHGSASLKKAGRAGRKPRLNPTQFQEIGVALASEPSAYGFAANRWTITRVTDLIARMTGAKFNPEHVRRLLRQTGLEWRSSTRKHGRRIRHGLHESRAAESTTRQTEPTQPPSAADAEARMAMVG